MATIDKQSVREEFDRIKTEFNKLVDAKKVNKETELLFNSMFTLFNLLISIFLERLTKKTSKNSSKPPSQTTKDESTNSNNGSNGKGLKEKKNAFNNTRTIEKVTLIEVYQCDECGADLRNVSCKCHERRTKIDIIFEKVVTHVDVEIKVCPNCKAEVKGNFPSEFKGPLQYGNGLKAFIIY